VCLFCVYSFAGAPAAAELGVEYVLPDTQVSASMSVSMSGSMSVSVSISVSISVCLSVSVSIHLLALLLLSSSVLNI